MGKKYPGFSLPSAFHSPSRAFQVLNPNAGQLDLGTGPTQCSGGSLSVMQGEDLKAKGKYITTMCKTLYEALLSAEGYICRILRIRKTGLEG